MLHVFKAMSITKGITSCRAKFGETAFLDVYQKLYEAPDPAPALSTALVRPSTMSPTHSIIQYM
jgi:hypothetical protein